MAISIGQENRGRAEGQRRKNGVMQCGQWEQFWGGSGSQSRKEAAAFLTQRHRQLYVY